MPSISVEFWCFREPLYNFLTLSQTRNFELFQIEEFADNNLKLDDIGWKVSKWVENTVGKGEIACYKQFLLFSQCFQIACFPGASKGVIVWEWVKCTLWCFTLSHTITTFNYPGGQLFGKHCGIRRKCWLPRFSPFPTMFSTLLRTNLKF